MLNDILIIGAGGVGGYLGFLFQECGVKVSFLKRNSQEIEKIIDCGEEHDVKYNYLDQECQHRDKKNLYDLIIIATKQYDILHALDSARLYLNSDGQIITVQNGLHRYKIPLDINIKKSIIYIISQKKGSFVNKTSNFCRRHIEESSISSSLLTLLKSNFRLNLFLESNIDLKVREKMVYISSYSAIICYLKKPIGSIREDKEAFDLYINLLKESIMVAESQGFDLKDKFDDYLSTTLNAPFDSYCSLYHDLLNSEMNEYEAILGDILNLCLELNLNTPYIVNVYSSIKSNFTIK